MAGRGGGPDDPDREETGTLDLSQSNLAGRPHGPATPFAPAPQSAQKRAAAAAGYSALPFVTATSGQPHEIDDERTGTMALTEEESSAAASGDVLPFDLPDDDDMPGTMTLSDADHLRVVTAPVAPFPINNAAGPTARSTAVPGAPWTREPTEDVSPADGRTFTVDLPKSELPATPAPAPPPPAPEPPPEKKKPAPPQWRPVEPAPEPPPVPVVQVAPRPNVKGDVYGGFTSRKRGPKPR